MMIRVAKKSRKITPYALWMQGTTAQSVAVFLSAPSNKV